MHYVLLKIIVLTDRMGQLSYAMSILGCSLCLNLGASSDTKARLFQPANIFIKPYPEPDISESVVLSSGATYASYVKLFVSKISRYDSIHEEQM
jgi:hypothetical protein